MAPALRRFRPELDRRDNGIRVDVRDADAVEGDAHFSEKLVQYRDSKCIVRHDLNFSRRLLARQSICTSRRMMAFWFVVTFRSWSRSWAFVGFAMARKALFS